MITKNAPPSEKLARRRQTLGFFIENILKLIIIRPWALSCFIVHPAGKVKLSLCEIGRVLLSICCGHRSHTGSIQKCSRAPGSLSV